MASGSTPARQAHGEVAQGDTHRAVVVNGVSSDDEPSVEWGWHGHYPKVARFAGFVVAAVLLIMLYSNYYNGEDRVWLVGPGNKVRRTFEVTPSTVDPTPGAYTVTSRSNRITGSDGIPVEHVVRFAGAQGVAIGFSAAVDGSTAAPDPDVIYSNQSDDEPGGRQGTAGYITEKLNK